MKKSSGFPECAITPETPFTEPIQLACFIPLLSPLKTHRNVSILEYRMIDGRRVGVRRGESAGPIYFEGHEAIETRWTILADGTITGKETHWVYQDTHRKACILFLREIQPHNAPQTFEDLRIEFPVSLQQGVQLVHEDMYFRGARTARERFIETAGETCRVTLGGSSHRCIKLTTHRENVPTDIVETFIDITSGLVVLQRKLTTTADPSSGIPVDSHIWIASRIPYYKPVA